MTASKEIFQYHEQTKHHYDRYAKSPGYMDWENQPNPFRVYQGTPTVSLPLLEQDPAVDYAGLFSRQNRPARSFDTAAVAGFLELSVGLSAWKASGAGRWALRMNPSSGNLHPTEAHLVLPDAGAIRAGVYHYNPLYHRLEKRAAIPQRLWDDIRSWFGVEGFFIGLASIFWRESWKYGERAFRYCNLDVGHALAGLSFSAGLLGWKATRLNAVSDAAIETLLGLEQTAFPPLDAEHPDLLCFVHPAGASEIARDLPDDVLTGFAQLDFGGQPNVLSKAHVDWEIIYRTARLTRKPATSGRPAKFEAQPALQQAVSSLQAPEIIRQRRSATAFDPRGRVGRRQFLTMLDKSLPRDDGPPFDVDCGPAQVHLLIFVHGVDELEPGLYFFFRNQSDMAEIKNSTRPDFLWSAVADDPRLYLLQRGNFRQQAMMVSCHQEIAGQSAFSLGMVAKFRAVVSSAPYRYRHLFWEAGLIGQVLYLEAEAHGFRGTGIGCFFDDAVHNLLGFKDNRYQSLYHFTIGKPVEDLRLETYPPYSHLKNR